MCLLKELFLKIPEYFGTKPLSPLLELSVHKDKEDVFFLPSFIDTKGTVVLFLLCPLVGTENIGFHSDRWWDSSCSLAGGRNGKACLSEKKQSVSLGSGTLWGSDEAPTHHHTEARKEATFLFYKSITGRSTGINKQEMVTLWKVAVLVVAVVALLKGLVMECQPSWFQSGPHLWSARDDPWKHWEQALYFSSSGVFKNHTVLNSNHSSPKYLCELLNFPKPQFLIWKMMII